MLRLFLICLIGLTSGSSISHRQSLPEILRSSSSDILPKAIIGGITDCGNAELVNLQLDGCTNSPCSISSGTSYNLNIDFKPRDFHVDLHVRMIMHQEAILSEIVDATLPDSTVQPGELYNFAYTFTPNPGFQGAGHIRLALFQNYVHELCLDIPVIVS